MDDPKLIFNNAKSYLNFIGSFPRTSVPTAGSVMCMTYAFIKNKDFYKLSMNVRRFFDWQPAVIVLHINTKNKTFVGLNLHHLSVEGRELLISRLLKVYPKLDDQPRARVPGLNYVKLLKFLRKSKIGIRCYRWDRIVGGLKFVPGEQLHDLIAFYANFTYKSNYAQVKKRYDSYRPK